MKDGKIMKKSGWGGARPGSGRKAKFAEPTQVIGAAFPRSLIEAIDSYAADHNQNRSDVLVEACRRLLKRHPAS